MKTLTLPVGVLTAFSAILSLCQPAEAGHWSDPVYFSSTSSYNYCASITSPYQHWDGGAAYNVVGQVRNGDGPGFITCKGTITADFTWIPDYDANGNPDSPGAGLGPGHYNIHCNGYGDLTLDGFTINFGSGTYADSVNGQNYAGIISTANDNHQIWDVTAPIVDITVEDNQGNKNLVYGSGTSCDFDVESTETGTDAYGNWYDWDATASCSFNAVMQWVPAPQ